MAQLSDDCFAFRGRLIPLQETSRLLKAKFACVAPSVPVSVAEADGRVLAEDWLAPKALPLGYTARVFTGAVIPDGSDTALMQEDCAASAATAHIRPGINRGANRRLTGQDVTAGSVVLRAGRRPGPPDIGVGRCSPDVRCTFANRCG